MESQKMENESQKTPQKRGRDEESADVASSSASMVGSLSKQQKQTRPSLYLDGESLTPEELYDAASLKYKLVIKDDAWDRMKASRLMVESILARGEVAYGINTGFGNFASVVIPPEELQILQENLIRSHSAGVGNPLPLERARMLLVLRVNVLCKGNSGIRPETVKKLVDCFNKGIVAYVPEKGTVGASGDLAPLAHLALGLIGEGKLWDPQLNTWCPALETLTRHSIEPIKLAAKEGLSLINGTQFITALGVEALVRAERACKQADVIAALSLEVLRGSVKPFNAEVHRARPHPGQKLAASILRALMHDEEHDTQDCYSEIGHSHENCSKVQDSYTLRCLPQVHGIVHDTIQFVRGIITTEMNSATDNPMVFASTGKIISGGNFHGEYPAKALDYLAIGIHEISSMSERRIERLCNPALSELPAFLVEKGGLNSGFMIAHCTAAALVSENKVSSKQKVEIIFF
eukprot:TRINITY_DN515_c0_g1_i1.p1 TRINITY_DN515_c0_g1~~TRINITY_DN515_c0_g1_i1.p1  ORF type:complete len:464 (-),score=99.01 TRINITY_DN515_c0_g1_i1:561-1952(-)